MSVNNVFQRVPRRLRGWVLPAAILLVWWAAVAGGWGGGVRRSFCVKTLSGAVRARHAFKSLPRPVWEARS